MYVILIATRSNINILREVKKVRRIHEDYLVVDIPEIVFYNIVTWFAKDYKNSLSLSIGYLLENKNYL